MKYLNPKADLPFKRIFGEHPDLVISLLNALLPLSEEEEIKEIEYLPSDMVPDNPLRKYSIVDVRCRDKQGRQFLVEMQMLWSPEFRQRVLFNASKAYVRQLDAGCEYELLQPVYSLNLVNEVFEPELPGYYHYYSLVHQEHSDRVIEGLKLIFVELPKFTAHTYAEKRMQVLWLRFLTEIDEKTREVPEELRSEPDIKKALTVLEESAFSDAELYQYEKFWDIIRVEKAIYRKGMRKGEAVGMERGLKRGLKKGMEKGIEQGIEKGIEQGIEKGIEQGIEKGIEKGIEQGLEKGIRQTAANMKRMGLEIEFIVKCTGLTEEEILSL